MKNINRLLQNFAPLGPVVLRVVLGGLFVLHGLDKFSTGVGNVEGFFASNGVPLPELAAPLVAVAEVVLGVALIVGLATRLAALGLALVVAGAIIWVKNDAILGSAELDLAYLAGLLAVALIGPGPLSVDGRIGVDGDVIDLRAGQSADDRVSAGV